MASNCYFGGSAGQSSNMLTYSMKSLSVGPTQHPHSFDLNSGSVIPTNLGHPFSRSSGGNTIDSIRAHSANRSIFSDFLNSQIGSSSSSNVRPSVLSGMSGGFVGGNPLFATQNGLFKTGQRPITHRKSTDIDESFSDFRVPATGQSSRVLSSLQDSAQLPFNYNASDVCSSFLLNRYGAAGGDNFNSEGSLGHTNGIHTGLLQNSTATTSSLENMLSSPQTYTNIFPTSNKPNAQASFKVDPGINPPLINPGNDVSGGETVSALNHSQPGLSGSQYYSSRQLETTRDLQVVGALKAVNWILVPPVPEGTAAHMRTGRVHELKSRACSDRVFNASYMDHELKQVLHNKIQACLFTCDEATKEKLPRNLGAYTDLVPLETMHQPRTSVTFGLPCVCFKAWSPRFNRPMLLRRVLLPVEHEAALSPDGYLLAKHLSELDHPAVVGFRDVFFTNAFNDNSAVLVYEYTPCSSTLQQAHMCDPMKLTSFSSPFNINRTVRPHSSLKNGPSDLGMLPESTIWSYLVQLTHGIRFIHQQVQRACGVLDPTKVLIQDGTHLRINCFGLKDVLFHRSEDPHLTEDQAADFVQLGKLIIGAACGTSEAIQNAHRTTSFNLLQRTYTPDLVTLLRTLICGQVTDVDQLVRATAPFVYEQLTNVCDHSDFLERQLFLGMECDRLFRMVCKLQSIVERSDRNGSNPDWSETGDRYMLKLFRDFVFHQTDHLSAPFLDLAHIITTLNKVEAGSSERLCLVSRDSQNVIIVTYADIKQWLDASFAHLVDRHRQSRCDIRLAQLRDAHQQQQQQQAASMAQTEARLEGDEQKSGANLLTSENS
ncbi:PAB-dependent poly(A)-specific ribonuclease subunit 3 [Paragonimus westermani]|uniref:PAB-dependent poly(A)-specific ribonuclease subunit 3 n=1 Tax=Paragonimus westermani TaxID=34504 RepID=A0A5J4NMH8_9TREM|nr:PAB-dependent poly(A)-specific ribonuclease subunit 3 [Paragonimus westermani]